MIEDTIIKPLANPNDMLYDTNTSKMCFFVTLDGQFRYISTI